MMLALVRADPLGTWMLLTDDDRSERRLVPGAAGVGDAVLVPEHDRRRGAAESADLVARFEEG